MKNNPPGMTLIVKTVTRLTVGLILIYGIYIVLQGHIGPGGGFAGGIIIALSFIHLMLAFGKEAVLRRLSQARTVTLASLGATVFLILATSGFMASRHPVFSREHFTVFGSGLIPYCDIAIALMVGTGIFAIFLALTLLLGTAEKK
jgi:multicomponent Na+:H+ antiporter subunit B